MATDTGNRVKQALQYVQKKLPATLQNPRAAVICGSGLGGLADSFDPESRVDIPYSDIPNFASSTVSGHASKLVFGYLGDKKVPGVAMVGRLHYYEGHSFDSIGLPIRLFNLMKVQLLVVTNAAGALNPEYNVGDLVILEDHINLPGIAGNHPLRGPNDETFGPRFPALSDAYDVSLRQTAFASLSGLNLKSSRGVREGVYAFVGGPSFETRAEARMLRTLGADLVGMSTVPEVIVARHCDLKVFCVSLVTNKVVMGRDSSHAAHTEVMTTKGPADAQEEKANHAEVLAASKEAAQDMQKLVTFIISGI